MPTPEKEAAVAEVAQQLKDAKSVFLTDFTGLNVEDITELRRTFTGVSVQYRVVKNTLARLSLKEAGCEDLLEYLDGPTAMAFGMDDPVAPARVIKDFAKKHENLKVRACMFEGVLFGEDKVGQIADLPSREQMVSKLCGVLQAPLSNLVYSLNGVLSKLVYAINAVKDQKANES